MNADLKAWARAQVEEQMRYMTRQMDKDEQDWCEALYAYEKMFGKSFPTLCVSVPRRSDETALICGCIEAGEPYELDIPEGAII